MSDVRITLFVCDPEEALHRQLAAQADREWLEWIAEQDRDEDEELRLQHLEDLDDDHDGEWPWWMESPYEICEPEIIDTGGTPWI